MLWDSHFTFELLYLHNAGMIHVFSVVVFGNESVHARLYNNAIQLLGGKSDRCFCTVVFAQLNSYHTYYPDLLNYFSLR